MPVSEYKKYDVSLIAKGHSVDEKELQLIINWYQANKLIPGIAEKRKKYERIDRLADKLIETCEEADENYDVDAVIQLKLSNAVKLKEAPNVSKGRPPKANRQTFIMELSDIFRKPASMSRREPHGPLFHFVRDVFDQVEPDKVTDDMILNDWLRVKSHKK
ncbi:MAG TPA: hypothetical protein DDW55_13850 [Gammaproteobacteria bacterium]|nr:hypothetical protein [Gammaproteobacteria bacterium]